MFNLIKNEFMKLYAKKSSIIVILILVLIGVVMAPLTRSVLEAYDGAFYLYTVGESLGNINFFTIMIASSILNAEFSQGTIKFLLLRPKSRSSILLSKIIAIILNSIFLSVLLFVVVLISSFIFFEESNIFTANPHFAFGNAFTTAIMTMLGNLILVLFHTSIVFLLSVVFKSQLFTSTIGYAVLFLASPINFFKGMLFSNHSIVRWSPFNLLHFRDNLGASEPLFGIGDLSSIAMGIGLVIYTIIFLILSLWLFENNEIEV